MHTKPRKMIMQMYMKRQRAGMLIPNPIKPVIWNKALKKKKIVQMANQIMNRRMIIRKRSTILLLMP